MNCEGLNCNAVISDFHTLDARAQAVFEQADGLLNSVQNDVIATINDCCCVLELNNKAAQMEADALNFLRCSGCWCETRQCSCLNTEALNCLCQENQAIQRAIQNLRQAQQALCDAQCWNERRECLRNQFVNCVHNFNC